MSFLGKILGRRGADDDQDGAFEPARNRTFSATQFREEELARAAEARARTDEVKIDAAQVLSPAINPVAERLMAEEADLTEEADRVEEADLAAEADLGKEADLVEEADLVDEVDLVEEADLADDSGPDHAPEQGDEEPVASAIPDAAPSAPVAEAMPWDEAAGWLSQRSTETRNFVGQYWNWDYDLRVLHFLAQQPDLDAGVAAHIFWLTAACEDYFPFGDDDPDSEISKQIEWLTDFLGRRFAESAFASNSYGFDDSWDCERLKERLAELHDEGRLDWSPDAIPTSSSAELMSFDDIPEAEREEVTAFLARFGVY